MMTRFFSSGSWQRDGGGWRYVDADGSYPKNAWKQIDGEWYHFDANGHMQSHGWYREGKQMVLSSSKRRKDAGLDEDQ